MIELKQLRKPDKERLLEEHRGILAEIARKLECNPSLVSQVFWGKATSRRVRLAVEERLSEILTRKA